MGDRLRRYIAISAWVIGVGGLFLAAVASGRAWAFVFCVAILVIPVMIVWREQLLFVPRAVMGYRALQQEKLELQDAVRIATAQVTELEQKVVEAFQHGEREGYAEARGQMAAHDSPAPMINATRVMGDDLVFICHCPPEAPHVAGLRYALMDSKTKEVKGLVVVSLRDDEEQSLHVSPAQELTPSYWERVRENAIVDSSPPPGVELVPYVTRNRVPVVVEDVSSRESIALEGPAS